MRKPPNIVLILSDQHNARFLGSTGNSLVRTPHLERFASEGLSFSNTYCASPLCVPSRASLMTSHPCNRTGVWTNQCVLPSEQRTWAHALSEAGYETFLCGRMHFNGPDQWHGFQHRILGDVFHGRAPVEAPYGIFGSVLPSNGQNAQCVTYAGPGSTCYQQYDREVTDRAIQQLSAIDPSKPFALVVGYMLPHNPFICPPDLFEYYYSRISYTDELSVPENLHPAVQAYRDHRQYPEILPEQARIARAAYCGLVELLDREIGQLLQALESKREETLVIYTSDHGESAGENGLWTKGNFHDSSVRVPMIWRFPAAIAAGKTQSAVVSLLDVGTTLAAIAGSPQPFGEGRDLRPLWGGGHPSSWPNEAISLLAGNLGDSPAGMIRSGRYKLNRYFGYDAPQLFDLESDPRERTDLRADPAYTAIQETLSEKLARHFDGCAIQQWKQRSITAASPPGSTPEMEWTVKPDANHFDPRWQAH